MKKLKLKRKWKILLYGLGIILLEVILFKNIIDTYHRFNILALAIVIYTYFITIISMEKTK